MKRWYVNSVGILFAALCFALTACNQGLTAGKGTGTVRIVIGSGVTRSVDAASGLPVFDETNTKITVTKADGSQIKEGKTSIAPFTLDIGTEITVAVAVTTTAGEWRGSEKLIVKAGENAVTVKISKVPKTMKNILHIDVNADKTEVTLKLASGQELLSGVQINNGHNRPVTARDGNGRIYVLYEKGGLHFARFDAEGGKDTNFENAIMSNLLMSTGIKTMTVDSKTGTIFVLDGARKIYAVRETGHNTFACSNGFDLTTLSDITTGSLVTAVAAYNNELFLASSGDHANKLIVCGVELTDTIFSLSKKNTAELSQLRTGFTECTGLFADKSGAYCLLSEQQMGDNGSFYTVGALAYYSPTENSVTYFGKHSQVADTTSSLVFEGDAFSNPVSFIGADAQNIYIADDGVEVSDHEYLGLCVTGEKNRVVTFDRAAKTLSFQDSGSDVKWFGEYRDYPAKTVPHLLWSRNTADGSVALSMKTLAGSVKKLVEHIDTRQQDKLRVARDSRGCVYVLYREKTPTATATAALKLERFYADGTKDPNFGTAKTGVTLPADDITDIAVDFKTADLFLLKRTPTTGGCEVIIYMAKAIGSYTIDTHPVSVTINDSSGLRTIDSVTAFDGTLFFALKVGVGTSIHRRLYASKIVTRTKAETVLPQLRQGAEGETICTGLFADRQGVYALLAQHNTNAEDGDLYALGKIVRYTYNGSTELKPVLLTENNSGFKTGVPPTGSIEYSEQYFSNPVDFIGYDGDTLFIADDGINIDQVNENLHVNGNKNRIAAFNRKTNRITFTDTEATWYAEHSGYKFPETKMLLWQKAAGGTYYGMQYWVADTANTPLPVSPDHQVWFSTQPGVTPTDVFCYDQDGNLYIVYKDSSGYKVRRFALKEDGSYDTISVQNLDLNTPPTISAIAADISDGKNYLYYADTNSSPHTVKRFKWGHSSHASFSSAEADNVYTITLSSSGEVTALAANKDGVFVGVREWDSSQTKYTLKVGKYAKDTGAADGEGINLVTDAPLETVHDTNAPHIRYKEAVHDLRIVDGTLYAITSKLEEKMVYISQHRLDEFRSSGVLYKVGQTANTFTGSYDKEFKKEFIDPPPSAPPGTKGTSYGFYRFIAVKSKKLVIASDSAWGKGGTNPVPGENQDTDTVLEYDLATHLASEPKNAGGGFSKQLIKGSCEFKWN